VLALLDSTPQHRSWWPMRRLDQMNSIAKFAIAAAAVIVVALIGINLLPRTGGTNVGGAPVTASPLVSASPTLSASPTAAASPTVAAFPSDGPLAVGRHTLIRGDVTFSVELTKPGWSSGERYFFIKDGPVDAAWSSLLFWDPSPKGVFADPCAQKAKAESGASTAALAADVASLRGAELVQAPTDTTVGGHPAKRVTIRIPQDAPCPAGEGGFYLWYGDRANGEDRYVTKLGDTMDMWIIDVDGTRLVIDTERVKGAKPAITQELETIVDSIQFE
jgi:hypothetical protein